MSTPLDEIKYDPGPGVGHELGIMFGFIAAMLLAMAAYTLVWRAGNKRSARQEEERIQALKASGWLKEKAPFSEEEKLENVDGVGQREGGTGVNDRITEIKM